MSPNARSLQLPPPVPWGNHPMGKCAQESFETTPLQQDINMNLSSQGKKKRQTLNLPAHFPTPIPNPLKPFQCGGQFPWLLTNNSPPHYRPLIQWCLFKQYSHLLLNNKGIKAPLDGAPAAPASQQPQVFENFRWALWLKSLSVLPPCLLGRAYYTPDYQNRLSGVADAQGKAG